jgi:flagellar protein FliO/FliZ
MPSEADGLTLLSLATGALVLGLWGALWGLRRMRPSSPMWGARDCAILRSLSLGQRERLVIVRVGARQLVLGIGSGGVTLLCELDQPLAPAASAEQSFGEAVRKAARRWHRD